MSSRDGAARASAPDFLTGGGEMGALVRAHDWSATPLGAPDTWPQSLRSSLSVCLNSSTPSAIYWGPGSRLLYNDAYSEILVDRHPWALGQRFEDVWPEAWPMLGPQLARVVSTGHGFAVDRFQLMLRRQGELQETHWFYSFAPIRGEGGAVLGVFVHGREITTSVRAERQQACRLSLEARLRGVTDPAEAIAAASEALGRHLSVGQVAYSEVEPDSETVLIEREWNDGTMASNAGRHRLDNYGPVYIAALKRGERIAITDVRLDPRTSSAEAAASFARASIRSFLNVPLMKAGRLAAVLAVHSATPRAWSPEEVALAEEVAERTWDAAARARAEASLRDAEERYLALFNGIDQGFCTIEVAFDEHDVPIDYRFIEVSPSFERQTGIENGAGRWMREIAPNQDQFWFDTYGRVALTGEPARFENHSTPLGRWWDVYAFRISGPRRIAVLFRDITDKKRAEAALRESEARFRLMADAVPQIVWITDAEGRVEFFNRQWSDYTGAAYEPATAAEVASNHVHPDDAAATVAAFDAARRIGTTYTVEHRIRSKSGEYRWFLVRGKPYRDPGTDEITRWFGASVDIHDRKLAEASLRELNGNLEQRVADALAERRVFAQVIETTKAAVLACDLDFRILAVNAATAAEMGRVYGVRPEVGDSLLDVLSAMPDHRAQVKRHWGRALAGEEFAIVDEFGDPGRERVHYEVRFSPLRDRNGERIGAFQTAYEVTDRVRGQAELAAAQEALRQSQKMESLGQLTGGVAHDFNNLLTVIRSSADLLRRRELPEEKRHRYIDAISDTADRAARLTSQLLAFARRQALKAEVFDVAAQVDGIADMLRTMLGPRVGLVLDAPHEPCFVDADPGQLETALVNMAVNARDAMDGGGNLTISVNVGDALPPARGHAGAFVAVSVLDTGCGMRRSRACRAHLRAVLHDKGGRQGHRLGPFTGVRLC